MSLVLAIIGMLGGVALGLRYKVLVLVPAGVLAIAVAMIIGIARADHLWSIALAMMVLWMFIQFGYFVGVAIRAAIGPVILLPHAQAAQRHARKEAGGANTQSPGAFGAKTRRQVA
jgi:hypothetical protein